ncbi:MAG: hypothetical protein J07HN4v3_03217 [Halonotius sp. J07HN4]|nr:MAG: hypothetical protein J07HN4v3_03217 [Halonotius sp. J07HN4]
MVSASTFVPAIVLLPFVSFVVALFGRNYLPKRGAFGGIAATAGSLALSLWVVVSVRNGAAFQETYYTWAAGVGSQPWELTFGALIDPLSALMLVIVSSDRLACPRLQPWLHERRGRA